MAITPFELENFFHGFAREMLAARDKAISIHHTKDIVTAGNEVEISGRGFFEKRLPSKYYVGHGHIVDKKLNTSPQLDVIITDALGMPVLFKANDGSEYLPYESVYGFGEIKSSYIKSKTYIHKFTDTIKQIKSHLEREQVSPWTIANSITLAPPFKRPYAVPFRNPLLTFMLFVDGSEFDFQDVARLYGTTPAEYLPTAVCFVNRGFIINGTVQNETFHGYNYAPEFADPTKNATKWSFGAFGPDSPGTNLAFFYMVLAKSLTCLHVDLPDTDAYINAFLKKSLATCTLEAVPQFFANQK